MNKNNGGRIFLCTDGLANQGIGSFDNLNESIKFYKKIGEMAKISEICINLITFSDSESNIQVLINMVQETGGEIIQLNPNNNFDDIETFLNNDIIASKVQLEIKLNKILEFKNQDIKYLENDSSCFKKFIGNIKKDMNLYFQFAFKTSNKIALMKDINLDYNNQIPFQTIIEYKDLNGNKNIRVYTEMKSICNDLDKILKNTDFEIISAYAVQNTAKLLLEGKFKEVNKKSLNYQNFFSENQNINQSSRKTFRHATSSIEILKHHTDKIINSNYNKISDFIIANTYKLHSQPMNIYKDNEARNINKKEDVFNQYNDFKSNKNKENKIDSKIKEKKNNPIDENWNNNKKEIFLNAKNALDELQSGFFNKKQSKSKSNIGSIQIINNEESIYYKLNKLFDKNVPKIKRAFSDRKKNKSDKN